MKLIYVVTEDWYFYSHRLPMARAAKRAGFDVAVICHVDRHRAQIEAEGIRVIPFSFQRQNLNPFLALRHISGLARLYWAERPDLVHHIAMKPVLFGSIAARMARVPNVLNAFAGLGMVFHADIPMTRILRPVLVTLFRVVLKRKGFWTLFQNRDDLETMKQYRCIDLARTDIIRGSGVDVEKYPVTPMPPFNPVICVFAGRMIEIKGLVTLHDAFEILKDKQPRVHLWLCGTPDPGNPQSWDEARLRAWEGENPNVTWKGHQAMAEIWPMAHIGVQPTIGGEGLPKAMLEAAACARAMIASNVAGCREIVQHDINGILVDQKDPQALADAILTLARDPARTIKMGQAARAEVERDLSAASVMHQTEHLYKKIMLYAGGVVRSQ